MAKVYGPPLSYSGYTKSEILDWKNSGSHKPEPEEEEEIGFDIPPSYIDDPIADVYGPPTPIEDNLLVTPEEEEITDIDIPTSYIDDPMSRMYGPDYDLPPVTPDEEDDNMPIDPPFDKTI